MRGVNPLVVVTCLMLLFAGCVQETPPTDDGAPAPNTSEDPLAPEEVEGGQGQGGGNVRNAPPTVESFSASPTTGENDGTYTVTFTGQVKDTNTEAQISTVAISATGPETISATHTVTPEEAIATTEPSGFGADGFKVWSGTTRVDGVLEVRFQHTFAQFAPSGVYDVTLTVTDRLGETGTSGAVQVTVEAFSLIEVAATPVLLDGTPDPGSGWGAWTADPGASNVPSTNYIKLVNTGDVADAQVVVDFTDASFQTANGTEDPVIPIDGNLRFAWFEDTTPGTTAPNEGTFTFASAGAAGSVTVEFSGTNNVIYVAYQILEMPEVLPIDTYSASYTVTEL